QEQIEYEIYSQDGDQETVHCQGQAVWSGEAAPARLDVEQLKAEMRQGRLEADRGYAAYGREGLPHWAALQAIQAIHRGNHQVLAELRLPRAVEEQAGDYVLHPSLLDGALQAAVGLIEDGWEHGQPTRLPFALDRLRLLAPCTREMLAWVRCAPGSQPCDDVIKLDIDLCDDRGNVCLQLRGFSSRVLSAEIRTPAAQSQAIGRLLAVPVWQHSDVKPYSDVNIEYAGHHVV